MANLKYLNVEAYDALLRHLVLEEPKKLLSFLTAHSAAEDWFSDFQEKWRADHAGPWRPLTAAPATFRPMAVLA